MDWKGWAGAAAIRALKTMGQTLASAITVDAMTVWQVDWTYILGVCLLAGVYSIATSLAGLPEVDEGQSPLSEPAHMRDGE